jgi:lipoate-protein ligase A
MGLPAVKSMGKAEYKIPGGKLLYAETEISNGRFTYVKISGDFFMHPEESINLLEDAVKGTNVENIDYSIRHFFESNNITLFGVNPNDFLYIIKLSLNNDK